MADNWIDATKRKPKPIKGKDYSENVFAWCDGKLHIMAWTYVEDGVESGWVWSNCGGDINGDPEFDDQYEVTHWMPLPKHPKKKLNETR